VTKMRSRSSGCNSVMRRVTASRRNAVLSTAVCGALLMLTGCTARDSEVSKLNTRIMLASGDLVAKGSNDISVPQDVRLDRPYVVVILPAERVSAESIKGADLPFEARETIQRQNEGRYLLGALIGIVQANRSEWQPLVKDVAAGGMLYVWKQKGESVSIGLARRNGQTVVSALR
jgi:hypothetical protein